MLNKFAGISYLHILIFFISCNFINAQDQLLFEHITTTNGLSSAIIHQTLTDKFGFLWVATRDGLNKYDGYNFTTYRNHENDKNSLLINDISTICEYNGKIWAGTWGGGISQFDGNKNFTNYINIKNDSSSIIGNFIQFLYKDSQNKLWICSTAGLDRFNEKNKKFSHYFTGKHILCIAEDKSGILYTGTFQYLFMLNKKRNETDTLFIPKLNVTEIFIDHQDAIWIGTDQGLFQFNRNDKKIIPFDWKKYISYYTQNIYIKSIFEDSDRNLWIATQKDGVFKLLRKSNKIINLSNDPTNPLRISYDNIYHFHEDNSKVLWISTPGGGLNKLDLKTQKFKYYTHTFNNPNSLNHKSVQSFFEDETGKIWIGTGYGLNKFDRNTGEFENIKLPLPSNLPSKISILGICKAPDGNIWLGTNRFAWMAYNYKLNKIINTRNYLVIPDWFYTDKVMDLLLDKNNNIWIGTWGGLFMYNFSKKTTKIYAKEYNHMIDNSVTNIFEDKDGIIWIGTSDGGLTRLDPMKNKVVQFPAILDDIHSLTSPHILSIKETEKYIWVGTPSGLNRIDKINYRIKRYTEKNGLINQDIAEIQVDDNENLWLATNSGITKFNTESEKFVNYTKYNGLPNIEFTWLSSYKARDNELFFGSTEGFISFYPDRIQGNASIPPIVITNFKVFNEVKNLPGNISELKEIVLNYNENRISFEFASLDYTSSQSNKFKYRLTGFDQDWIPSEDKRYANYTNLDPGNYTFQVIGSNNDGVWNTKGASIKLIIVPPVWQTWWFRITSILSLIVVGFVGLK